MVLQHYFFFQNALRYDFLFIEENHVKLFKEFFDIKIDEMY